MTTAILNVNTNTDKRLKHIDNIKLTFIICFNKIELGLKFTYQKKRKIF